MAGELDDILSGSDPEVTQEVVETPAPAAPEAVKTGDETPAPETPAAPAATPAAEPAKVEHVPLAALMAEREKRKELDRRLQQLEQNQPQAPDFFADPEGHVQTLIKQSSVKMSAAMVERQFPDFREKLGVFMEEAQRNPLLAAELESHAHPALFAYEKAKEIEEYRQMKDLPAFKEKLRAEIRAEVMAELQKQQTDKQALADSLPPDLSGVRGGKESSVDSGHESLETILK